MLTRGAFTLAILLQASVAIGGLRTWKPVVLQGSQLRSLLGQREDHLEVLAFHGDRLEPIPFQVDDVLPDGRFALPSGPHAMHENEVEFLGPDDQVVLMVSDLGPRTTNDDALPPQTLEIAVHDSLGGATRYAYIAAVASPLRSTMNYVDYDPELGLVKSDHYRLELKNELPDGFAFLGRRDQISPDIARGLEVLVQARLFGLFRIHFSEHSIGSELLAYKAGPIRVIRRIRHWVKLGVGIGSPGITREDLFYRDYIDERLELTLPWVPSFLFHDITARVDMRLTNLPDLRLQWAGMQGPPLRINESTETCRDLVRRPPDVSWILLGTQEAEVVGSFALTPATAVIKKQLYCRKEPATERRDFSGTWDAEIGYLTSGWEGWSKGNHSIEFLVVCMLSGDNAGSIRQDLGIPSPVEIRPTLGSNKPAFEESDVGVMNAGGFGQHFLRQSLLQPVLPD